MKRFEVGARVQEPTYGLGSVIAIEDAFVRIQFDDKVARKFLLRLAKLESSAEPAPAARSRARKRKSSKKTGGGRVAAAPKVDLEKKASETGKSRTKKVAKKASKKTAKKASKKTTTKVLKKAAKKSAKKTKKPTKSAAKKK